MYPPKPTMNRNTYKINKRIAKVCLDKNKLIKIKRCMEFWLCK